MAKLKTKPDLRFAEFDGEWREQKIGEIAEISSASRVHKNEWTDSGVPFFRSSDVVSAFKGTENQKAFISYSLFEALAKRSGKVQKGDVLITGGGSVGVPYLIKDNSPLYFKDADLIWIKKTKNLHGKFLFAYFTAPYFRSYVLSISHVGTISHYTIEQVKDTPILLPKINEQKKLGALFKNLDTLITLHQRKYDKTISIKKAMLEKMFPREGESKPEIRFAGFSEDWEQRRLGDVADIVRGASPRPIKDTKWFDDKSDIGWLRILDVTEQGGRIYHLEQRLSKMGQERTRVLTEPHLLLSIAATVGKPVINYVKTGVHDGFLIFQDPLFDREFMFQWLEMFRPKWQKYGQPGSQVNLNSDLVKGKDIRLPHEEEQKKIGQFFSTLDTFIALHQRELTKVKNIKKALLEKMFV